jgi:hypothetical protein
VVVNERTTVASGFALAQSIHRGTISGPAPGLQNAANSGPERQGQAAGRS